jgi:hypothetical protein
MQLKQNHHYHRAQKRSSEALSLYYTLKMILTFRKVAQQTAGSASTPTL